MKKYAGKNKNKPAMASIQIQYGKQPDIEDEWLNIVQIEDEGERNKQVDLLIDRMEQNTEQNGFYGADQEVVIYGINSVLFDDREMYYRFFEILRTTYMAHKDNYGKGQILKAAIDVTVKEYFGGFGLNKAARMAKTQIEVDDDENVITPSIRVLKGQNCSACMERAVMAHNLWLLAGKTSYMINVRPSECDFGVESEEYKNDGHAFIIVEYDGKYRLVDLALNNVCLLPGNPIEDIENGKPIVVEGRGVNTPGCYANSENLEKSMNK